MAIPHFYINPPLFKVAPLSSKIFGTPPPQVTQFLEGSSPPFNKGVPTMRVSTSPGNSKSRGNALKFFLSWNMFWNIECLGFCPENILKFCVDIVFLFELVFKLLFKLVSFHTCVLRKYFGRVFLTYQLLIWSNNNCIYVFLAFCSIFFASYLYLLEIIFMLLQSLVNFSWPNFASNLRKLINLYQKQPPEVFWKKKVFLEMSQISQENTSARVSFLKKLQARDPGLSCFPVNFTKFLSTPFQQNTSRRLLLFYFPGYQQKTCGLK